MIKNKSQLEKFNRDVIKQEEFTYRQALAIYEALHKEAVSLGVINSENMLEGLEVDIKIAKAINGLPS